MARLLTMFLILVGIQACLLLYTDQTPLPNVLWTFVTGLTNWGTLAFITGIVGVSAGIYIAGITAASIFGYKTDVVIFAPFILGLTTIGLILTNLANALYDDFAPRICGAAATTTNCSPVSLAVALLVGPVALIYIWTIVEWWRGRDF